MYMVVVRSDIFETDKVSYCIKCVDRRCNVNDCTSWESYRCWSVSFLNLLWPGDGCKLPVGGSYLLEVFPVAQNGVSSAAVDDAVVWVVQIY
jgi:hypothetical protein